MRVIFLLILSQEAETIMYAMQKQVAVLQSLLGMGPELPEVAQQLWTATVKLSSLLEDETIRCRPFCSGCV